MLKYLKLFQFSILWILVRFYGVNWNCAFIKFVIIFSLLVKIIQYELKVYMYFEYKKNIPLRQAFF